MCAYILTCGCNLQPFVHAINLEGMCFGLNNLEKPYRYLCELPQKKKGGNEIYMDLHNMVEIFFPKVCSQLLLNGELFPGLGSRMHPGTAVNTYSCITGELNASLYL